MMTFRIDGTGTQEVYSNERVCGDRRLQTDTDLPFPGQMRCGTSRSGFRWYTKKLKRPSPRTSTPRAPPNAFALCVYAVQPPEMVKRYPWGRGPAPMAPVESPGEPAPVFFTQEVNVSPDSAHGQLGTCWRMVTSEKWGGSRGAEPVQFLYLSFVDAPQFEFTATQPVETATARALAAQQEKQKQAAFRAAAEAVARLRAQRGWGDKPLWVGPNDAWACEDAGNAVMRAEDVRDRYPGVPLGTLSGSEWSGCVSVRFHTPVVPVDARLDAIPADRLERHIDLVLVQLRDGDAVVQGWVFAGTLEPQQ